MQVKKETKLWQELGPTNAPFLQPLCHNHHIDKDVHSGSTSLVERWVSPYYYWLSMPYHNIVTVVYLPRGMG